MKHLFFSAALASVLACAGAATAKPAAGPWGFDLAGRDAAAAPGQDFYQYANGTYLKSVVIPPDRSRYGTFDALRVLSENRVHDLLEQAAAHPGASADDALVGAFYKAAMDEAGAEALDAKPMDGELSAIRAAGDKAALARIMGRANSSFNGSLFSAAIQNDAKSPDRYAVYLAQDGLGLPDRDYYLKSGFADKKAKYEAYVAQTLKAVNWPDAEAQAVAIVDLESDLSKQFLVDVGRQGHRAGLPDRRVSVRCGVKTNPL